MLLLKQSGIYIYIYISMFILGPATNHSAGNGLNDLDIIEYPNDHKSLPPQSSGELTSTRNNWLCSWVLTHIYQTQQFWYKQNLTQEKFDMALQTGCNLAVWKSTFIKASISAPSAKIYAHSLVRRLLGTICIFWTMQCLKR